MSEVLTREQVVEIGSWFTDPDRMNISRDASGKVCALVATDAALRQQLAQTRAEVWEEAANKCHECLDMTRNDQIVWAQEHLKEMLHGRCQAFANLESWCREQAKEAQP